MRPPDVPLACALQALEQVVDDIALAGALALLGKEFPDWTFERTSDLDGAEIGLSNEGGVDLEAKLRKGGRFYNFHRPNGAHSENTPYEAIIKMITLKNRISHKKPHLTLIIQNILE